MPLGVHSLEQFSGPSHGLAELRVDTAAGPAGTFLERQVPAGLCAVRHALKRCCPHPPRPLAGA